MSFTSETIELGKRAHPQTNWDAAEILAKLSAAMPDATTDKQRQALEALQASQYSSCKIYPCLALDDSFIKAIGYMSSIPTVVDKGIPTLPTLIGESCRAIADAWYAYALSVEKNEQQAVSRREAMYRHLEDISQQIFAKGLGN